MSVRAALPVLVAAALAGCSSLAPHDERAAPVVADAWPVDEAGAQGPAAADVTWREFYLDARLRDLVEAALADNRDLRSAALAIEAARERYRIARAAQLPQIDASATLRRQGATAGAEGATQSAGRFAAQAVISAFELDFFGRLNSLRREALERYLGSTEALRAARITLVAEVATAYFNLAADQQRLRLAQQTYDSQRASYELTRRSFELGSASGLDLAQAQTSIDTARADIATFRTHVDQDLNALVLLVGRPIDPASLDDAHAALDGRLADRLGYTSFAAGLPSTVLLRRPDVMAAEHDLRAAAASVAAARADYFPRITLTTSVGTTSDALQGLFSRGSRTWTFAPAATLPLFDAGAVRANVRGAVVARRAAVASYDSAIQTAFREVADALAQRRDVADLLAARESLAAATEKSFRLSEARYRRGVDSYLNLLDAQRSMYTAQQSLITTRLLEATNLASLYSVLGGGWQ